MAESKGSQLLSGKLCERGDQLRLAGAIERAASIVMRWRIGKQKPDLKGRIALERLLNIPIDAWDKEPAKKKSRAA